MPTRIEGAVDFDDRRTHLTMDVRPNPHLDGAEAAEAGFPLEFMLDGGHTIHFADARMRQKLPPGKQWAKIDLEELDEESGLTLSQFNRFDETNPGEWLRLLRTAGGAREAGRERVRGTQTTRYRATIDPRRFPEVVPADERDEARRTVERLEQIDPFLVKPMPVDVWIDEQGLIRRERVKVVDESQGVRTTGVLTLDFTDFGDHVSVELPDGDEVVDVTDEAARELDGGR